MQKFLFVFAALLISQFSFGQKKVNWVSIEEAMELNKTEPRKIMIDIYTDWCGWCKKMEKMTFEQNHIADYLNTNYYPVKFNAEQKTDIEYNGTVYKYVKTARRGYHELAAKITNGRLSYPTVVFMDEELSVIQPIPGFQDANTFEMIMSYFADDHYKETPWKKYVTSYISPTKDHKTQAIQAQPASIKN